MGSFLIKKLLDSPFFLQAGVRVTSRKGGEIIVPELKKRWSFVDRVSGLGGVNSTLYKISCLQWRTQPSVEEPAWLRTYNSAIFRTQKDVSIWTRGQSASATEFLILLLVAAGRLCSVVPSAEGMIDCCLPCPATDWVYSDSESSAARRNVTISSIAPFRLQYPSGHNRLAQRNRNSMLCLTVAFVPGASGGKKQSALSERWFGGFVVPHSGIRSWILILDDFHAE